MCPVNLLMTSDNWLRPNWSWNFKRTTWQWINDVLKNPILFWRSQCASIFKFWWKACLHPFSWITCWITSDAVYFIVRMSKSLVTRHIFKFNHKVNITKMWRIMSKLSPIYHKTKKNIRPIMEMSTYLQSHRLTYFVKVSKISFAISWG